ncbi:MAG: lamin tail domain-containing protein [Verrucomicrobia bacterium]|nr:lamin tail domain-containing protein [Verrucomicrobiota bacterium]
MSEFSDSLSGRSTGIMLLLAPFVACIPVAMAEPVISEFMADNKSTLPDEDGAYSDWIEIHNPDAVPIDLAGWRLTDNAGNLAKWTFPSTTLQPGEFRIIFASEKHQRFSNHANFKLAKDGEYLALVRPDGSVRQQFAPAFPAQDSDESYGPRFNHTTLVAPGAAARYLIPIGAVPNWQSVSYNHASWPQGPTGLGFGLTEPGITARQVFKNGSMSGLTDALSLLSLPAGDPGILAQSTGIYPTVNFLGDYSDGRFPFSSPPPGGAGENYALEATGFVHIPTAGYYTFGLNSDDGGAIWINGSAVMTDDTFHGPEDRMGSVYLAAGSHSFRIVMFEGGGGDEVEFYAAAGQFTSWNTDFRLVGDTANGGLAATTPPVGAGNIIATNLQSAMAGRNGAYVRIPFTATGPGTATALSLVTRHNDGFAAWLNGNAAASHNAPASTVWNSTATASRGETESLRRTGWNLAGLLPSLANGSNILAIHGMRTGTDDTSFLVLPELVVGSINESAAPAFYGAGLATPGWINGNPSLLGKVADTRFSVKRGIFTAPFQLEITTDTPGAQIRYTTDGSTPTATNGTVYAGPLTISTTTNLRAAAFLTDWEPTDVDTQTYLFPADVIRQQPAGSPPAGWPSSSGTSQVLDFGMDPEIVDNSNPDLGGPAAVQSALLAIPSVVLTTDLSNLFNINGSQGIYSNPGGRGLAWERPVSVEWINPPDSNNPNGTSEFQINAGVRTRGGFSRSTDNPKHAFHLYFREDYGNAKLVYPLFGRHGAQDFDRIDLRTAQNYSWSFGGDGRNTFLREEASRVAQLDMGQQGSRVRYVHLYLNGVYWGLFNLDERTEAAFSASYFGGNKDDYDTVKCEQDSGYTTGVTDGSLSAWQELWNQSRAHAASPNNTNYFRMMGLAANGVTPTADPVLLDPDNLIDYLMVTFWTGNLDGCTSAFLGNDVANNWFGTRLAENNPRAGFRFFVHDFEHTFLNVYEDRTGPWGGSNQSNFSYSNPYFLHRDLSENAEYRMRWADRVQRHMFNDGALTPAAWSNRINRLATTVDQTIIAESARWGNAKRTQPFTRADWVNAQNELLNMLTPRHAVVLSQLRDDGLYPSIDAPSIMPFGGYQPSGVQVTMGGQSGTTLYYMPDGSDPRAVGGSIRPGAQVFTASTSTESLIPWSAPEWRWYSEDINLGTAWREPAFNDTGWGTGTAEIGYGDGDEATAIPRPTPRYATAYFRKSFTVTNPEQLSALTVQIEYDDAHAVYLNGTRIGGNLPVDPAYNYFNNSAIEDQTETISNIPVSLLVEGTNVVAVEIHQANDTSSDLSMNLSLSATRTTSSAPLILTGTGEQVIRARAYQSSSSTWSALSEAVFRLNTNAPSPLNLAISEIMYHPGNPSASEIAAGFMDPEEFEFLEITNTGTGAADLRGAYIDDAVGFDFNSSWLGTTLAPGARMLIVANRAAFEFRYGTSQPIAGVYTGNLSNSGETITLRAADDSIIRQVTYSDGGDWPTEADGGGFSLVLTNPSHFSGDSQPSRWRVSVSSGGNPGESDAILFPAWLAANQQTDPNADPDGDGRSNLLEYALGGNPRVPETDRGPSVSFAAFGAPPVSYPVITHRLRAGADSVDVILETTDDLGGQWQPETNLISLVRNPDGTDTLTYQATTPADTRQFWRVRAVMRP